MHQSNTRTEMHEEKGEAINGEHRAVKNTQSRETAVRGMHKHEHPWLTV